MPLLPNSFQKECSLPSDIDDNGDLVRAIAEEYRTLFLLEKLTDQDAARVEEILILARQDKQLDELITNIVYEESKNENLLSKDCLKTYKDQIAALREYQGTHFSGLKNTMFGNTPVANEDIRKLAIALQEQASCGVDQPSCPR